MHWEFRICDFPLGYASSLPRRQRHFGFSGWRIFVCFTPGELILRTIELLAKCTCPTIRSLRPAYELVPRWNIDPCAWRWRAAFARVR
jgi:hypothetical protein